MKKLLIYVFIFSILAYCALAADANIYEAQDFTKHPEQLAIVQERDLIKISWDGKEHQIHVRKVYYPEKQKVDLTAFIEGSEVPYYATITPKTSLHLDFNRDDIFDLRVSVFNFLEEDGKKFISLKLEKLETAQITTGEMIVDQNRKTITNSTPYILLGIGIILLIIASVFFKRKITNANGKEVTPEKT